jgi:hypothetical protein
MIPPTNGRVVWYWPSRDDKDIGHQPQAAMVVFVHSNRVVNLVGYTHSGQFFPATSVPLLQDGDMAPATGHFAEWMPYQKGQAARTEQAEGKTP